MPTFFQRPENALKRANEFIDVGKKQRALDALYDVIKSKKHRTWQKIHEPIMEKYLELCVELKKSHIAKEGLYQYKNICQQVNIKSLEDVVRKYLALAEEKTEAARLQSQQSVVDVDDLDVIQTPENLLLSAVSGEDTQDRTDRAILTPWVKFLWESYRQCLDLLRNNSSVEKLYQDIAQQAFKFCLKYQRKTEFRKLCDNLRTHLGHIYKHQHQQRAINLNNPDSQAMHLETRLVQLDSAIQMELWQEAFKAVEDIHGLITLSKKPPKPSLMANYYTKLGLVFWKSGNYMFHACAWHRLFHLSREQRKNLSGDELLKLSSRVLCATLAIPIPPPRNPIDQVMDMEEAAMEKQRRLTTLLGLTGPPTRAALIKDLVKYSVMQNVHPELQNLYRWLEVEFHPLQLSERVTQNLEFLEKREDLAQYIPALQDITITRLLKQIGQVYQTIEFKRLLTLAPFASHFHLERVIVDAARNLDLQVRIDHRTQSLSFGTDLGVAQKEDVPEGPYLQSMPTENIRNQLVNMAKALEKACQTVTPEDSLDTIKREELRAHIVQSYRQTAKKEHQRILLRRQIIEERKEELESINVARELEEQKQVEESRRSQYQAEMERLEREMEEREKQRRREEHKEIQRKAAKERLEQLKSTPIYDKLIKNMDEAALIELDADEIVAKQVEQLEKEKKEMQERMRQQEKKIDFLERAKRIEEIPLLVKRQDDLSVKNKNFWEEQEANRISTMKEERELALQHRDRLSRMTADKDAFLAKLKDARVSVYKKKQSEFEKKLAEERQIRLVARKEQRKNERRTKWIQDKEEEEQRRKDEELKRQREEEEMAEKEAREKEAKEYEEQLRKLEEMAEKQREKERQIEERERKRMEEARFNREKEGRRIGDDDRDTWRRGGDKADAEGDGGRAPAWRPKTGGGSWRDREKAKEESFRKRDEEDEPRVEREERGGDRWRRGGDDAPPRARDEPSDWRRGGGGGGGMREEGGGWRGRGGDTPRGGRLDDGPPRRGDDDRGGWRSRGDDRGPPRDEGRDAWRRGGDDRGPLREREDGGRDAWRRGGDDRGPRDRDDGPRDSWRRGGDRDGPRDDRPPRDEGRDSWRRGPREDDRRGPPARGGEDREDVWRRGPPRDGDDRGPPPRIRDPDDRPSWRGMPRDVRLDDPQPPPVRRSTDEPSAWRRKTVDDRSRGSNSPEKSSNPPPEVSRPSNNQEDDGWQVASGKR